MHWAILVTLLVLPAGQPLGAQENWPPELRRLFAEGVEAQKAGELDAAEKAFLQVLHEGGPASFVHNNLGIIYQLRREHSRAVEQFRQAIRLQPDYASPHILMGASLLALGKTPEAVRSLERAVELQPREPLTRLELAKAYQRAQNFAAVVDEYRALREIAPREPEYAYQLGRAYLDYAAWCYREIARINPRSARMYQTLGENYRNQGRVDIAVRAFRRAAQVDPKLPGVHLALAQIFLGQGKRADALREIEQELAIIPENAMGLAMKQKIESMPSPVQ